jgi:hypothetical protein
MRGCVRLAEPRWDPRERSSPNLLGASGARASAQLGAAIAFISEMQELMLVIVTVAERVIVRVRCADGVCVSASEGANKLFVRKENPCCTSRCKRKFLTAFEKRG